MGSVDQYTCQPHGFGLEQILLLQIVHSLGGYGEHQIAIGGKHIGNPLIYLGEKGIAQTGKQDKHRIQPVLSQAFCQQIGGITQFVNSI